MVFRVIGTDRIQRHIEGAEVLERSNAVVAQYAPFSTQRNAGIEFVLAAQADPAGVAEGLAQLDGGGAHAAGTGMDQYLLAGLGSAQFEYVQPGGAEYLGDGCGIFPAHALGYRQQMSGIHHHFIGHAATGQQGTDPVAGLPAGLTAGFDYFPGTFQPENIGSTRWRRVVTGLLQQVCAVDSSGLDAYPNLARLQRCRLLFTPTQYAAFSLQSSHGAPNIKQSKWLETGTQRLRLSTKAYPHLSGHDTSDDTYNYLTQVLPGCSALPRYRHCSSRRR